MHTFRFNSVFRHWVLLGSPVAHDVRITDAHLLHSGVRGDFLVATNPAHPFLMDPPRHSATVPSLVQEQPPLGEYELLLYKGDKTVATWEAKDWEKWFNLAQSRILKLHENTHVHHVHLSMRTAWLDSVGKEYMRVGDLIATSHPIAGAAPLLEHEILRKIRSAEKGYILHDASDGMIYAPSAPLHNKEVWYIPTGHTGGFDKIHGGNRTNAAEAITLIMRGLLHEWPDDHFVVEIITSMAEKRDDATWWIRIHQEERRMPATLTVLPLPEKFVRDLSYVLGPGRPE